MHAENIMVSVCMITYNHEKYIAKAIQSVLDQECSFNIQLVISNDKSTDSTDRIIKESIENLPSNIEVNYMNNATNIGMVKNFTGALNRCEGKYIALLDGDDFWVDTTKLQTQVNVLEQNKKCSFSFHKAFRIKNYEIDESDTYPNFENNETIIDEGTFFSVATVPTASIVYRSEYKLPALNHSHCDFMLFCMLLSKGKGAFIDKVMSAYRIHESGVSFNYKKRQYSIKRINELEIEAKYLPFSKSVRDEIKKILLGQVVFFLNNSRGNLSFREKFKYFRKLLSLKGFYRQSPKHYLTLAKTFIK
ncbi:glycosyltransferase [Winogradskyella sp.]|uniref:glycosyltransferase n=1 Tax=Winogradskyella sp. TaxID=1883156 RepID=UPI0026023020|nr:glycosyltransferase [Winogradskyella sp.]